MFIELNNIHKGFADGDGGQRKVLDGLHLHVEKGGFVAVTGVSGTGKTTLLNILGTLLQPDSGDYSIDGETVVYGDEHRLLQLRNRRIGFMFQDYRLLPQLSAWQNILLPTLATGMKTTDEEVAWARELARKTGIENVLQQLPETLSGGEKSRVALCRSLIMHPQLLLADEPTGQLDQCHAKEVARMLSTVNEHLGMTVILVTHSAELSKVARIVYELQNGRLVEKKC